MASVATCAKEADTGKATGKEEDSSATDAAALAEVIEFSGTDEGTAKAALRAANGDVRRAVNYVFDPSSIQAQAQAKAETQTSLHLHLHLLILLIVVSVARFVVWLQSTSRKASQ